MVHGYAFFIAVLVPVGTILLANSVVLSIVIYKVHQNVKEKSLSSCKGSTKKKPVTITEKMATEARIAFACNFLLGITWAFALLAVGQATMVFQWLFCIFNSLQGFFIFLFYTVRNQDVRNAMSRQVRKSTQRYTLSRKESSMLSKNKSKVLLQRKLEDPSNNNKKGNYNNYVMKKTYHIQKLLKI